MCWSVLISAGDASLDSQAVHAVRCPARASAPPRRVHRRGAGRQTDGDRRLASENAGQPVNYPTLPPHLEHIVVVDLSDLLFNSTFTERIISYYYKFTIFLLQFASETNN